MEYPGIFCNNFICLFQSNLLSSYNLIDFKKPITGKTGNGLSPNYTILVTRILHQFRIRIQCSLRNRENKAFFRCNVFPPWNFIQECSETNHILAC